VARPVDVGAGGLPSVERVRELAAGQLALGAAVGVGHRGARAVEGEAEGMDLGAVEGAVGVSCSHGYS
jgi:hypothetical protein